MPRRLRRGTKKARGLYPNIKTYQLKSNVSGIVQNRDETFLRPDQAVDIVNMHSTKPGTWSSNDIGYTVVNAGGTAYESGADVDGLAWFVDSSFNDHLFMAINGKLKEINTGTGVDSDIDASAGYTAGNCVSFAVLNDVLYTVDGSIAAPRKWDGTTAANAGGWPVSDGTNNYGTPDVLGTFNNRLLALIKNSSTVILSDFDDAETFTTGGLVATASFVGECESGDGQQLVGYGLIRQPRDNRDLCVLFKSRSTYVLSGTSGKSDDADVFTVTRMNGVYGALSQRAIIGVGHDVLALNEYGITSYSASASSGDVVPSAISSDNVRDVLARLNLNEKDKCWGIHLPARREVIWFLPTDASTECNEAIVYKYPSPGDPEDVPRWSRRTDINNAFRMAHGCLVNKTFYVGSYDGFVSTMFTSSKYGTTSIPYLYEYPYLAFGNEKQNKRLLNCELLAEIRSQLSVTVQAIWQSGGNRDVTTKTLPLSTTALGPFYGTALFGVDSYGSREQVQESFDIFGDGKKLKLKVSGVTSTSGLDFFGLLPVIEKGNISQHWN